MKKKLQKNCAKVIALAMAFSMVASAVPASSADAKAKKPKLSKKKVTVTVKKTKKVKIKNTKGIKKTKWSVKSKKIAKLSKKKKTSVVIKGVKKGKTTVTAKVKVKKKTYKLKLKVTVVKAKKPVVTVKPTAKPTTKPTAKPSTKPSMVPSAKPSTVPSAKPSTVPSTKPSTAPSTKPSTVPSTKPSTAPSTKPSTVPSTKPSTAPTAKPTATPTAKPTATPTAKPTATPTAKPTATPIDGPVYKVENLKEQQWDAMDNTYYNEITYDETDGSAYWKNFDSNVSKMNSFKTAAAGFLVKSDGSAFDASGYDYLDVELQCNAQGDSPIANTAIMWVYSSSTTDPTAGIKISEKTSPYSKRKWRIPVSQLTEAGVDLKDIKALSFATSANTNAAAAFRLYSFSFVKGKLENLTLTSTQELTNKGSLKFSDCTGYPEDFDIWNYSKVTAKVIAYDTDGAIITSASSTTVGNTKVCLNCTTDGKLYNSGWGDGMGATFLNNKTPDAETGVMEISSTTFAKDGTKKGSIADCFSFQTDKIGKLVITEIVFEAK